MGWIGVDLDGTLAKYDGNYEQGKIGDPVRPMLRRVKQWVADGKDVRIFTARANNAEDRRAIGDWTEVWVGKRLPVTNVKEPGVEEIWDEKARRVEANTGRLIG